jgi:peptide/nickel transport system substrate-binding protein
MKNMKMVKGVNFMRCSKKITLILVTVLVLSLLVSCGGGQQGAGDIGNRLTYAHYVVPVHTWDPHVASHLENQIFFNTYESLVRFDANKNTFIYDLAESYERSEDGLVWTFKLREGINLTDGTPFNAEVVKWNIERIQRISMSSAYLWDAVEEVKAVDEYIVEFHLSEPAPIDLIASSNQTAWMISPSVGDDDDAAMDWFSQGKTAGTGPYLVRSQIQGSEVILERNPDYWRGWGDKYIDFVVIKYTEETSTRRQMMESGEADMTIALLAEDNLALMNNPNLEVLITDGFVNLAATLNTKKPPLDNQRVRQAICYSYPAHMFVENIRQEVFGSIATDTLMSNALWGSK